MASSTRPNAVNYDEGQRLQALALAEAGLAPKHALELAGMCTSAPAQTIRRLRMKAIARGYDPEKSKILKIAYVVDAKRPGRPQNASDTNKEEVLADGKARHSHIIGNLATHECLDSTSVALARSFFCPTIASFHKVPPAWHTSPPNSGIKEGLTELKRTQLTGNTYHRYECLSPL